MTEANPGLYGYAVRQATYAFAAGNLTIPWTVQTANQNVVLAVSTPTYAQFRLDSTTLASNASGASAAEPVIAVFLHWNQGVDIPLASSTLDRRYFLCVAVSSTATSNDQCLLRQKTGKWVNWITTGTIGAAGLYNDGVAINAIWQSENYTSDMIFNNKIYHEAWIDATPVRGSSVTYSYAMGKTGTFIPYTFSLDNGNAIDPSQSVNLDLLGNINQWIQPTNGYDKGRYIQVQFSDNQVGDYFRINSYLLWVETQNRQVP